jgi:hypothetical protein
VWFARDAALSSFDPIGTALESMAHVKVASRLPSPAEMANLQALVVCTPNPDGELGHCELTKLKRNGVATPVVLLTRASKVKNLGILPGIDVLGWPFPLEALRESVGFQRSLQK